MKVSIHDLNQCDQPSFVAVCGPCFEHSPWIAEQAWAHRPFRSLVHLHETMCKIISDAPSEQSLALIQAHPDLVGRLARQGRLTASSTAEQSAAGLDALSDSDISAFERYNFDYRDKFGFPFVICARENRKDAILTAFPRRLQNDRNSEIATALTEIFKIAKLRLHDAVSE